MAERPAVLIVAGLDPSGGAGLVADVRVCEQHGVRPLAIATALTEQDTIAMRAVNPVAVEVVAAQLAAVLADVAVAAVKLGMLGSVAIARAVAAALADGGTPVVWDPVGRATRGAGVFSDDELVAVAAALGPRCTLVTPNADELTALAGLRPVDVASAVAAGERVRAATGVGAVLAKGGHWGEDGAARDVLVDGDGPHVLTGPRLSLTAPVHGTGCALSTAIACNLALGATVEAACRRAKTYVAERIAAPARPGGGRPAVL